MTIKSGRGRVLGLDHGSRRVGIALSDGLGLTAHALEVVPRRLALSRVVELVAEYGISQVVVGLPTSLSGREGPAAEAARKFAAEVRDATGIEVVMIDERYSTVTAERAMLAVGSKRRARRQSLDKVAAAVILQSFLDRP